ncbi:MAG: hypothetical protein Q9170_006566, partial [Blastenia crenularia]
MSVAAHGEPSKESRPRDLPQPPSKPINLSSTSPSSAMPLSRSGTLSWQQRPTSRGSTGPRTRPLSQIAAENNKSRSPRASVEPPSMSEREVSREQIAESLGTKDPAWFKQTHERGTGSAAYRRNQDESISDTAPKTSSMPLPGMSRQSTVEPERQESPATESIRSISPSRTNSIRGESVRQSKNTTTASISSSNGFRSPLPNFAEHTFAPPSSDASSLGKDLSSSRGMPMSPSQGRISPERFERPASPTKGLGGFVQSAMLKRSDSVNKRWSAQPGTGLSRGNSIASNRSGYEGPRYGIPSLSAPRDPVSNTPSREASPVASSRPTSSHGRPTYPRSNQESGGFLAPVVSESTKRTPSLDDDLVKPTTLKEVMPSSLSQPEDTKTSHGDQISPPVSPSKRWSPTKASWLENAINKPDSPKPRMPPPQQPSWMANINQAKQQRGGVDLGQGSSFKEVSTGGLLRSPPMGAVGKPPSIGGLPSGFSSGINQKSRTSKDEPMKQPEDEKADPVSNGRDSTSELDPRTPARREASFSVIVESEVVTSPSAKPAKGTPTARLRKDPMESPQSPKPKPETPPKKDFRSNLKPRQTSGEAKPTEDAEFKNVFGKLRRTQTQNYVAPDELKDNILRGKAGLALTGGPKKTERRDEFKESLLKQKEAMKAGPPPVGRKPSTGDPANERVAPIPEGLAKRSGLTRSTSNTKSTTTNAVQNDSQPEALAKFSSLKEKPQPTLSSKSQPDHVKAQRSLPVNGKLGPAFNTSLAGVLSRGPSPGNAGRPIPDTAPETGQTNNKHSSAAAPHKGEEAAQLTHMTKSRARGPKRRLPKNAAGEEVAEPQMDPKPSPTSSNLDIIKTRSETKPATGSPSTVREATQSRPLASISNNHRKPSQPQPSQKPSLNITKPITTSPIPPIQSVPLKPTPPLPRSPPSTKPKPSTTEFDRPRKPSISVAPPSKATSNQSQEQVHQEKPFTSSPSGQTPESQSTARERSPLPSVKGAATAWGQNEASERILPLRAKSPIKLPTRKDEEAAMQDAGLVSRDEKMIGLGINTVSRPPPSPVLANHNLPTPPLASPKSSPPLAKKPLSIANHIVPTKTTSEASPKPNASLDTQPSEASRLFAELFHDSPSTTPKVNIDTPSILATRASPSETNKIRTLRKQISEITPAGKFISLPQHQSHILFEESLYIVHHVFGTLSGARTTEVYLWCGDGVPTSAIGDAQVFAKKEAKDHGGKLVVLAQGKETSEFFQALGGIVITRHGQSDRVAAKYMLCGRRHVGQIAFDEIDFSPKSLCKGFPYLILSGTGKVYLWKGIGSGIDELGCARLIGMDLGAGGEIEEIDDGNEPAGFWNLFPNSARQIPSSSGFKHWHLKPSSSQYTTRLYSIDIELPRPKSTSGTFWGRRGSAPSSSTPRSSTPTNEYNAVIKEITPYAQSDIFHDGVFVLDTFFEIFV